jgi:hypothetical protein
VVGDGRRRKVAISLPLLLVEELDLEITYAGIRLRTAGSLPAMTAKAWP